MSGEDVRIAWGLKCQTVALKAKTGQLTDRAIVDFLADTLQLMRQDDTACQGAADFARSYACARTADDRIEAGQALERYLVWWSKGELAGNGAALEQALADAANADLSQYEHDWQGRSDAGI